MADIRTRSELRTEVNDKAHSNNRISKPKNKKGSGRNKQESQLHNPTGSLGEETVREPLKKKDKKRKHLLEESEAQSSGLSRNLEAPSADEPPKKKHKNRTEFADPRVDTVLNPQSRKALEYAFLQMNRPSKWRFNKARQNWLIRHVWDPELIPGLYFPFVLKYLANVQGGSRQKLKETCKIYLKSKETVNVTEADSQPAGTLKSSVKSVLKKSNNIATEIKAGPLIDVTSDPALLAAPTLTTKLEDSSTSALASIDIRKTRAQSLLDILGSQPNTQ